MEKRLTEVFAIEPQACGLPHVRTLVVTTKWVGSTSARVAKVAATGPGTINRHVSSLPPQNAVRFARLIRGHWGGCEIRNHWVRDVLFKEDATRCKDLNLNGNLAVMRCALIGLKSRHAAHLSWPDIMERSGAKFTIPYNLVCYNSLK